jgi:hypothetical protein
MSNKLDNALIEQDIPLEDLIILLIPSPNGRVSNESRAGSFDETIRLSARVEVGKWARLSMKHLALLQCLLSIEWELNELFAEELELRE